MSFKTTYTCDWAKLPRQRVPQWRRCDGKYNAWSPSVTLDFADGIDRNEQCKWNSVLWTYYSGPNKTLVSHFLTVIKKPFNTESDSTIAALSFEQESHYQVTPICLSWQKATFAQLTQQKYSSLFGWL